MQSQKWIVPERFLIGVSQQKSCPGCQKRCPVAAASQRSSELVNVFLNECGGGTVSDGSFWRSLLILLFVFHQVIAQCLEAIEQQRHRAMSPCHYPVLRM